MDTTICASNLLSRHQMKIEAQIQFWQEKSPLTIPDSEKAVLFLTIGELEKDFGLHYAADELEETAAILLEDHLCPTLSPCKAQRIKERIRMLLFIAKQFHKLDRKILSLERFREN
jgi:hypothetical protein